MSSAALKTTTAISHDQMANAIRTLAMDAVEKAKSGHPGMPMGMADVATVLYTQFLRFDPKHPGWPDRDRFVLSAGHGSMLQYALHYLSGFEDMTLEEIKNFRQWGAKTAGHPEYGHAEGIETTTGPLGQGITTAVGMAMAERALNAEFGDDLVNHYTYVIAGDGCLMEGISLEAASLAGHMKLNKLIVLWDDNQICIDGPTSMTVSDDHCARFAAQGWATQAIDGHDPKAIAEAIKKAQASDKPTLIACRTIIAKGAPTKAGKNSSHGSPLGAEEIAGSRKAYGWEHGAFEVPDAILSAWRDAASARAETYSAWESRFAASDAAEDFTARMQGDLGEGWVDEIRKLKQDLAARQPKEATRASSQNVLEAIVPQLPALFGGSADLTGSNNTKTKPMTAFTAADYAGRYVYYGVREHGMAASMNGIALHGGFIPYGGTFLVFTDYCRPAIRLSALMQQRVIYVMTHDSIGLGEDGPTHQPVEHLASLRAIPNLNVFRPADSTEVAECWQLAIATGDTPSILALSRQGLPHLRTEFAAENKCAKGAYVLREASAAPKVVIMGTGSETHLAVQAAEQLEAKGIPARVVSVPCLDLFLQQPVAYRKELLPAGSKRIAIEAGIEQGWEKLLGEEGVFIGMKSFGASAPAEVLYEKFGITVDAVVKAVVA
jgi:transketolase